MEFAGIDTLLTREGEQARRKDEERKVKGFMDWKVHTYITGKMGLWWPRHDMNMEEEDWGAVNGYK